MNRWSARTVELVTSKDYLDRLQEIYPNEEGERDIDKNVLEDIRKCFIKKDNKNLLDKLLDLEKFPYKDSYVGFLRKDRTAIARNPKTVKRISDRLQEMGIENVIDGITQPKEANMRRGSQFAVWLKSKFKSVNPEEFKKSSKGIVILDASELESRDYCNKVMGIGISKRPDLVAKSGRHYVVGEAKFLSSTGGNQGRAFDDGMTLATNASGSAFKVFVLDGIHWIERGSDQFRRIAYGTSAIFSALLLSVFLKSL